MHTKTHCPDAAHLRPPHQMHRASYSSYPMPASLHRHYPSHTVHAFVLRTMRASQRGIFACPPFCSTTHTHTGTTDSRYVLTAARWAVTRTTYRISPAHSAVASAASKASATPHLSTHQRSTQRHGCVKRQRRLRLVRTTTHL